MLKAFPLLAISLFFYVGLQLMSDTRGVWYRYDAMMIVLPSARRPQRLGPLPLAAARSHRLQAPQA